MAARLSALIAEHGPRSVAIYAGTYSGPYPATIPFAISWLLATGSRMVFTSATIDQPGKNIANALHGRWLAGSYVFDESDAWLLLGNNPLISMSGGIPPANPARRLREAKARGLKLVVIDPRYTEVARSADVYLQPRPGEDPTLLAALLHVVIRDGLVDRDFVRDHVSGFAELEAAVAPFTPAFAAERAGVPAAEIERAARVFGGARRGCGVAGTGPNMGPHGSLTEYLLLCLNTVCGRWRRAGEQVPNPGALLPKAVPVAQAQGAAPRVRLRREAARARPREQRGGSAHGRARRRDPHARRGPGPRADLHRQQSDRGLARSAQDAPRDGGARPARDARHEALGHLASRSLRDRAEAVARGAGALALARGARADLRGDGLFGAVRAVFARARRAAGGSDVIEEWEFFYGLAQRMGLALKLYPMRAETGVLRERGEVIEVDMARKPTTDEIFAQLVANSRVPLEEVKRHPHGALFADPPITVAPGDLANAERLDVGNADLLRELAAVTREGSRAAEVKGRPFRLVSRRMPNVYNSSGRDIAALTHGRPYNPAFLHPDDLAALGLAEGDTVRIASDHASILGVATAAPELRRGVLSMSHAFGDTPDRDGEYREIGSTTGRLVDSEREYDR